MIRQCLLDHGHSDPRHTYGSPIPAPSPDPKRCPETIRAALHHVPPVADNLPLSLSESERAAAANPGLPAPPKEPVMSEQTPAVSPTGTAVLDGAGIALKVVAVIVLVAGGVAIGQPDILPDTQIDQQVAQIVVAIGAALGIASPGLRKK